MGVEWGSGPNESRKLTKESQPDPIFDVPETLAPSTESPEINETENSDQQIMTDREILDAMAKTRRTRELSHRRNLLK